MADYWIKWYHEIIDDPKMATLPDRLWRRFTELCLLAGRLCTDKSGKLPDTRQLAWLLRMTTDELQGDLDQIAAIHLIEPIPNGWFIVNFEKRQRAATSTERVHQHRERKQRQQYNGDETDLKRNVTQKQINRLTESETESETEKNTSNSVLFEDVIKAYEQNIGVLTPMIAEKVQADFDEYGGANCVEAITVAVNQNVRKWAYVQGILKSWKRDGKVVLNTGEKPQRQKVMVELPGGQVVEAHT
jgi:DnaD/phage-associated family protein